jgi:ribosome assembly protein 1
MYGVISRRRGHVVHEDMVEGSSTFNVTANIPVIESFEIANELRQVPKILLSICVLKVI